MEIMNLFKGKTNSFENLVGIEIIQTGEKSASCIQMTLQTKFEVSVVVNYGLLSVQETVPYFKKYSKNCKHL